MTDQRDFIQRMGLRRSSEPKPKPPRSMEEIARAIYPNLGQGGPTQGPKGPTMQKETK
jgi:hypothetical protein